MPRWLWLLQPVLWLVAPIALVVLVPWLTVYWWLYPEWHAHDFDFGTPREQEYIRRVRRFTSRVSVWTRLGRVLLVPLRGEHYGRGVRRRPRP
jgi:hypothetical protein